MPTQPEAAKAIEAILMVAQEPVEPHLLAQLLEVAPPIVEELCAQLAAAYVADDRGFVLAKVAGGYRFQSHADLAPYVERFVLEGQSARLSGAALETLAIVAYKQPLSRAQVASIRGVNVDGVMRTLLQRGYLVEVGRDSGPGQATLFGTSQEFLERLGLDSLDDLPPIADLFPNADVMEALERGLRADPITPPAASPSLLDAAPAPEPVAEAEQAVDPAEPVAADEPVAATEPDGPAGSEDGTEPTTEVPVADGLDDDPAAWPEPPIPVWALDADDTAVADEPETSAVPDQPVGTSDVDPAPDAPEDGGAGSAPQP